MEKFCINGDYFYGRVVRSGNGWGPGPEYGIIYRMGDGRYLGGVRHHDRGDLMTELRTGRTVADVTPTRWR